jgi:hypothetical protein
LGVRSDLVRDTTRGALMRATGLLDSPPDQSSDRLTSLATRLLDMPVSTVTLVEADRQFFFECVGVGEPPASQRGTPLSPSFCQYVVGSGEALVVEDARNDPLVAQNIAIRDRGVIAYAGMRLRTSSGVVLGSFAQSTPHRRSGRATTWKHSARSPTRRSLR